ncbi:MAG: RDD family protein [Elusimicrobiales bacterium]|jgi:uncharacterized RDD family membrane protein YckC
MENDDFQFSRDAVNDPFSDEPRSALPPPEDEPRGLVPAGFNERFLAYAIDAAPFVLGAYLTFSNMVKNGTVRYSFAAENRWKLGWIAAYLIYETLFSSGGRATLGKALMGIRVRASDGSELPAARAFIRAVSYFLSAAPLNLGYFLALVTPEKRALHDYLGGSRVVSVKERGELAGGLVLAVSWALMVILSVSWVNQNFLRLGPEEKKAAAAARTTIYKIAKLEEIYKTKYGGYTEDLRRLAALTGNPVAVRNEIIRNTGSGTLVISTDGRSYVISAKAKNWHRTSVEVRSRY